MLLFCIGCFTASAQDLEPRAYSNLPKGMNVLALAYGLANGNIISDPGAPISGLKITTNNLGAGYVHTFGLLNKLARVQVIVPFVAMTGSLKVYGKDTSGARTGFGDSRIRLGINLLGSPALDVSEYRQWQEKTILGVSLVTQVPTGLYYQDKLINIGKNRWGFKPEVGVSRRFKHFFTEGFVGVWFYTNNTHYLDSNNLKQQPVFSIQAHGGYYFKNQIWVGVNANYFNGGKTSVNGTDSGDLLDTWRVGAIGSVPFLKHHSLKVQFHIGAFTNSGYNYNFASISYQYIFF